MQTDNTLWLIGHPEYDASVGAKAIATEAVSRPHTSVHILRPNADWDWGAERARWEAADHVVLHFPLYWYGMPGLLKSYLDELLKPGWAFGKGGDALQTKSLTLSTTTGAALSSYAPDGKNVHDLATYFLPMARTAAFTGMRYMGVVGTGSVPYDVAEGRWAAHVEEVFSKQL